MTQRGQDAAFVRVHTVAGAGADAAENPYLHLDPATLGGIATGCPGRDSQPQARQYLAVSSLNRLEAALAAKTHKD